MSVAILDTEEAWHAILPECDVLWARAGKPPFQSSAWLLPWWQAFGTARPLIGTWRESGVLAALLPMYLLDEGRERKLLPVGVGVTDYCDALVEPGLPTPCLEALLWAMLERALAEGVTSVALTDLAPDAALRQASLPDGWTETTTQTPCPVLVLPPKHDALRQAAVPPVARRNLRQSRNRADRDGGWHTQVATPAQAPEAWQILLRLHKARWDRIGQPGGVLADPRVQAFHRRAVPELAEARVLRMRLLSRNGRVTAAYYTLVAPGRLLFYLSGFDEADAHVSPGTLLLGDLVEQALAEGVRELHFLRGAEAYKYVWGAVDRMNVSRFLVPAR